MVRKRSWPAVSQICSFTRLPSSSIVLILKSMPMVVMNDGVNESSLKRSRQQDLPTPESPIRSSLICRCEPRGPSGQPAGLIQRGAARGRRYASSHGANETSGL